MTQEAAFQVGSSQGWESASASVFLEETATAENPQGWESATACLASAFHAVSVNARGLANIGHEASAFSGICVSAHVWETRRRWDPLEPSFDAGVGGMIVDGGPFSLMVSWARQPDAQRRPAQYLCWPS